MFRDLINPLGDQYVFLGGTVGKSTWRDILIPKLDIPYFNPVVKDWTPERQKLELKKRLHAAYVLYVITPAMEGVYSVAEAIDDSDKRANKTIFCILDNENGKKFNEKQMKSLKAVGDMIVRNGGKWIDTLDDVATYLNTGEYIPSGYIGAKTEGGS